MTRDERQLAAFMLRELERPTRLLHAWQLTFLASASAALSDGFGDMTHDQYQTLRQLYAEATA